MSTTSKNILPGTGYNPALGPQSTDPRSATHGLRAITTFSEDVSNLNSQQSSPLPSPGTIKKQMNVASLIYDRNLYRSKHEVSLSSLSFLFMQIISLNLKNSTSLLSIERKLNNLGYTIGLRYLELTAIRLNFSKNISSTGKSNSAERVTKLLEALQFIMTTIWKNLFDKQADSLEKSSDMEHQYMIIDNDPLMTRYIGVTKEYESLNCEAFVAGIIEGILDVCYFKCEVSAHRVPQDTFPNRTVYVIKFDNSVLAREARLK
jgi:hypothetical protein